MKRKSADGTWEKAATKDATAGDQSAGQQIAVGIATLLIT